MTKKIIKDIRLYASNSQNENGTFVTTPFADKKLTAITKRVVMKLRENEFSLGEFDHLYINFTTCDISKQMYLSDQVDRYHPWYRYCSVRTEKDLYDKLGSSETHEYIIQQISSVLVTYFATESFDKSRILSCIQQAVEQGEKMLMKFKEKVNSNRRAVIFLRYLDICKFQPLLQVYDTEDNLLFEKDLPETLTLDCIGDIQISAKKVRIKPRKNAFTTEQEALVFEY